MWKKLACWPTMGLDAFDLRSAQCTIPHDCYRPAGVLQRANRLGLVSVSILCDHGSQSDVRWSLAEVAAVVVPEAAVHEDGGLKAWQDNVSRSRRLRRKRNPFAWIARRSRSSGSLSTVLAVSATGKLLNLHQEPSDRCRRARHQSSKRIHDGEAKNPAQLRSVRFHHEILRFPL